MKKARKCLNRIVQLDQEVDLLLKEQKRLKELITSIPAQDYSTERVQTSPENHTENNIVRLLDMRDEIDRKIDQLVNHKTMVYTALRKMEVANERILLQHRYIEGKTWVEVAEDMHFSQRHITRLHQRALESFEHVLECPAKDDI